MPTTLHITGKPGAFTLMERVHECCGETEYGDHCRVSDAEAASLVASTLVTPWFDLERTPVPGIADADPAAHVGLECTDGINRVLVRLPASDIRRRVVEVEVRDCELWSEEKTQALLARTRIADWRGAPQAEAARMKLEALDACSRPIPAARPAADVRSGPVDGERVSAVIVALHTAAARLADGDPVLAQACRDGAATVLDLLRLALSAPAPVAVEDGYRAEDIAVLAGLEAPARRSLVVTSLVAPKVSILTDGPRKPAHLVVVQRSLDGAHGAVHQKLARLIAEHAVRHPAIRVTLDHHGLPENLDLFDAFLAPRAQLGDERDEFVLFDVDLAAIMIVRRSFDGWSCVNLNAHGVLRFSAWDAEVSMASLLA